MTDPDLPDSRPDLPVPSGVIPGGTPDPVRETAPHADPAPEEVDADGDGIIDSYHAPIYPVPGGGPAVPPPPTRPVQE